MESGDRGVGLVRRIREYVAKIDAVLEKGGPGADWEALSREILAKIGFFQHERLVHLIVTMSVSLLLVICVIATFLVEPPVPLALIALVALFFVLVVPYMVHYFRLENAVQDLYRYYDLVRDRAR